jgi:hypothetical protein
LHDVYLGCQVPRLRLLGRRQILDLGANQEIVCQIVQLRFGDVGLFEDLVTMSAANAEHEKTVS